MMMTVLVFVFVLFCSVLSLQVCPFTFSLNFKTPNNTNESTRVHPGQ